MMEPLDLKKFAWISRLDKRHYIIMAITTYNGENVVVYREAVDRSKILVASVDDFGAEFEATYQFES